MRLFSFEVTDAQGWREVTVELHAGTIDNARLYAVAVDREGADVAVSWDWISELEKRVRANNVSNFKR